MKTTLNIKLRKLRNQSGKSVLTLQIIRNRMTRIISTSCILSPAEWDENRQELIISKDASPARQKALAEIKRKLKKDLLFIQKTSELLAEQQSDYSAHDLAELFRKWQSGYLFCENLFRKVEQLKDDMRFGTAHAYRCAGICFLKFLKNKDVCIEKVNGALIKNFERYLQSKNKSKNTISCYMRSLRSVYNQIKEENILLNHRITKYKPFSNVFMGIAKTKKRAIDAESITRLAQMDVNEEERFAIDLFMFSFFTHGMSFSDMANLKKENIEGKVIRYNRKKTGQPIVIEMEACMEKIIKSCADADSDYVFPILRGTTDELTRRKRINSALAAYNSNLNKLAISAGIRGGLTSHVARHTWASLAAQEGIPITTISRGLGHETERTTRIYISELDMSDVGRANRQVLSRIGKTT